MTTTLEGFDAGDTAALRLHVVPVDGSPTDATTTATVELLDPAGETRAPTAFPNADRSEWTATLDDLLAGEYVGLWKVTGTGEGREPLRILVGPSPMTSTARTYATTGDLAEYLQAAPPVGARRLLVQATRRVDELLTTAVYDVDDDGMPTDPDVAATLRDATCAQAAWFDETGDEQGSGIAERYTTVRIGNVQLAGPGGSSSSSSSSDDPRFAPDTVRILRLAGLLSGRPWVVPL